MHVLSLQVSSSNKGLMDKVLCELSALKDLETFLKNSEDGEKCELTVLGICVDLLLCYILYIHFGKEKQRSGGPNIRHALFFWFIIKLSAVAVQIFMNLFSQELDFSDPRGSALVLAAERGQISSCLRLLHAGATATEADLARIAKASEIVATLCQLRPEEVEELISKGEDEMQEILRRKHRKKNSGGDEGVKENSKASNLYEVCYSSVWIRREPHVEAAQVSKRIKGQQLNIEDRSVSCIPFLA